RIDVLQIVFPEGVVFLGERGLHRFRRGRHGWTGIRSGELLEGRMQNIVHREEDDVQRVFAMLFLNQVVNVGDSDLRGKARINCSAARAHAVQFRAGVIGVDDVLWLNSQALKVGVEQGRIGVNVQDARNADTGLAAI